MHDNDSLLFLLSRLQEDLNKLVTEYMDHGAGEVREDGWSPNIDVLESVDEVEIVAEVPGFQMDDLTLEVSGQKVILSGQKRTRYGDHDANTFDRLERAQGRFRRQIDLETPVNSSLADARLAGGLLRITFPRIEDKRRQVREMAITAD